MPASSTVSSSNNCNYYSTASESTSNKERKKLGDGCYHIYLDVGANIGVHTRFLYEPTKYPKAWAARKVFEREFGTGRNNSDFCSFGFEPNPVHELRHYKMMNEYDKVGWRYHYIQAGVSDMSGNITFYHNQDDQHVEEVGFSNQDRIWGKGKHGIPVTVPTIRLSTWLKDEILDRKIPDTIHGVYNETGPKVVMKMDIESSEYRVLPDLMFTGILCKTVDFLFGETHNWPIDYDADPNTGRGELHLQKGRSQQFLRNGIKLFQSFRDCKTRIEELDDEAYLHDGVPFPLE